MVGLGLLKIILPIVGFSIQVGATFLIPERVGQGKLITKPLRFRIARYAIVRKKIGLLILVSRPGEFRSLVQLLPVLIGLGVLSLVLWGDLFTWYWTYLITLYVDDYLSDVDQWKKRWESAKNKVKWLWTPSPAPSLG